MGRMYAGILGTAAFATVTARGVVNGNGIEATVPVACACLFTFAAIGGLAGMLADRVVRESVTTRVNQQLRQQADSVKADPSR